MNLATPNTVIPTGRLPNTKSETVSVKKPEVTNTSTPTVNSKPSLMSLTSSDSGPKIPDSQFTTLYSQWLPFMNTNSPWLPFTNISSLLLPFMMELHPSLLKKLLRLLLLKPSTWLPSQRLLPAGPNVNLTLCTQDTVTTAHGL